MYLSRLVLNPLHRSTWRDLANRYDLHRTIMSAFPDVNGDVTSLGVLYRVERDGTILVQSLAKPTWSLLGDRHDPTRTVVKNVNGIVHEMRDGMTYRFKIEANPTKKVNGARVPLVTDRDCEAWLRRKGTLHGFVPLKVTTSRNAITCTKKGKDASRQEITINAVTFEGILKIVNENVFQTCVLRGMGRGKAFGLGLLSIAR